MLTGVEALEESLLSVERFHKRMEGCLVRDQAGSLVQFAELGYRAENMRMHAPVSLEWAIVLHQLLSQKTSEVICRLTTTVGTELYIAIVELETHQILLKHDRRRAGVQHTRVE